MTYDDDRWKDNEFDYRGLEDVAAKAIADGLVLDELDVYVENDIIGTPFVDWNMEQRHLGVQRYIASLALVLGDGYKSYETRCITRVSYHFGHAVCNIVLGRPSGVGVEAMADMKPKPGVGYKDIKESLLGSVDRYLSTRPVLDEIIDTFVPDIDISNARPGAVRLVAGSTIMCVDDAIRDRTDRNVANRFREIIEGF